MRSLTRRFLSALGVALLSAASVTSDAQSLKIGVFDPQRVSETTALGKQVQAELSAFRDRRQKEINDKQSKIEDLQRKLTQQELSLSPDKRNTLEKDIQKQLLELQSAREAATRELQLEISAAQNSFQDKLILVVENFGQDEEFTLVLDRSLTAWAASSIDVTTAIIDRFDKMFPAQAAQDKEKDKDKP